MYSVWQHLLANVAVIAVFISLRISLHGWFESLPQNLGKFLFGTLCGVVALAVMSMPFELAAGVIMDLRGVPIVLAGFFAGPIGGIIAGAMALMLRIYIGGAGVLAGAVVIIMFGVLGILAGRRTRGRARTFADVSDLAMITVGGSLLSTLALPEDTRRIVFEYVALPASALNYLSILLAGSVIVHENRRSLVARTNEIYGAVMDALPDCLNAKDPQGRFLVANPATAKLMGAASKDQLIGRTDFDFYPLETALSFQQDEDRISSSHAPVRLEQKFVSTDGSVAWLSTLKVPFPRIDGRFTGIITHNRDITAQKELELALVETQARLTDALAHMADGLAMFDSDGHLVYCNSLYRQMLSHVDHAVQPGATVAMILADLLAGGRIVVPDGVTPEEWLDRELAAIARLETTETQLLDGRWIQKRHRSIRDGAWLSVLSDITEHKKAEHSLQEANAKLLVLAHVDGLTGLTNRRAFDDRLYVEFSRAERHNHSVGLLLIDIDRFKAYNDTYGHPEGDSCLRAVAECLKVHARRPSDVAARYGGEEFVAIFPDIDGDGLLLIAEAFRQAIRTLAIAHVGSEKGLITVSVGASLMKGPCDLHGPADLLRLADQALYRAKGAGRDCVRYQAAAAEAQTVLKISA